MSHVADNKLNFKEREQIDQFVGFLLQKNIYNANIDLSWYENESPVGTNNVIYSRIKQKSM